jgi:tetratricopeptide (TPR) repeat protein
MNIDAALRLMPKDRKAQEFRALCHFAQKRYAQAAADLYDVLAAGPGWDWATLIGLYGRKKSYETHLRNLEDHVRGNEKDAAARFVLAYHYLTAGHSAAARRRLDEVIRLKPEDEVAKSLLRMISGDGEEGETPEEDEREAVPPLPESFDPSGEWTAKPKDGGEIVLMLTREKKFTWRYVAPGKSAAYAGNFVFDRSRLLLEDPDEGAFIARITPEGDDVFVFRPEGEKDDPGIRFTRSTK